MYEWAKSKNKWKSVNLRFKILTEWGLVARW